MIPTVESLEGTYYPQNAYSWTAKYNESGRYIGAVTAAGNTDRPQVIINYAACPVTDPAEYKSVIGGPESAKTWWFWLPVLPLIAAGGLLIAVLVMLFRHRRPASKSYTRIYRDPVSA